MIQSYQKFDTLLNFGIEKTDAYFLNYFFVKSCLEFFFVQFSHTASNKMHEISEENINFILSQANDFSEEDLEYIKQNFDISMLYEEDSSLLDMKGN